MLMLLSRFKSVNLLQNQVSVAATTLRTKKTLDYSKYPKIVDSELEEKFVRGSGPGGQAVNKTSNAVVLRHIPTNIVIKCHIHRSVILNQKEARKILLKKLDNLYNGDESIEAQERVIYQKKLKEKIRRRKKLQLQKEELKNEKNAEKLKNEESAEKLNDEKSTT